MRIYNRELSDAEVTALAAQPVRINRGPLADADSTTIIGSKGATKALEVSVYDDGLPADAMLEYSWNFISGDPAGLSIADETDPTTTVSLLEIGTYQVQLETSDGDRTTFSEVITVYVNASGTVIIVR